MKPTPQTEIEWHRSKARRWQSKKHVARFNNFLADFLTSLRQYGEARKCKKR